MKNFTFIPSFGLDAWTQANSRLARPSSRAASAPTRAREVPGVEPSLHVEEREMTDEERLYFGIYNVEA